MAPLTQAPQITLLNRDSHLFDIVVGVVASAGAADAFKPVVLDSNGFLDPNLTATAISAIAFETIVSGSLVNLYDNASVLTVRLASAADNTKPAAGFVMNDYDPGDTVTVHLTGRYVYSDSIAEFNSSDIGKEVFLSAASPGHSTKTAPAGGSTVDQVVGYVVAFTAGGSNLVTIAFGTGVRDFSQMDGVVQITQGGTGATTNTQALLNLIGGSPVLNDILQFDGSNWVPTASSSTPGGVNGSIQFKNGGAFGGDNFFKWDTGTQALTLNGSTVSTFSIDAAANSNPKFQNLNYTVNNTGAIVVISKGTSRTLTYQASGNATIVNQLTGDELFVSNGTSSDACNTILGSKLVAFSGGSSTVDGLIGQSIIVEPGSTGALNEAVGLQIQMVAGGQASAANQILALNIVGTTVTGLTGLIQVVGVNVEDQSGSISGGTIGYGVFVAPQTNGGYGIYADAVSRFSGLAAVHTLQTTTYTAQLNDFAIHCNGTFTVTLPVTGIKLDQWFRVKNIGTGTITVASSGNIDGLPSVILTQNESIDVQWDGSTWWIF